MINIRIFRLRPKVEEDLAEIYEHTYQVFGGTRAEQYIKDLDTAFHTLANKSGLGYDAQINCSHIRIDLILQSDIISPVSKS